MSKKPQPHIAYKNMYRSLRREHALTVGQVSVATAVEVSEVEVETQQDAVPTELLGQVIALLQIKRRDDYARRSLRLITVAPEAPVLSAADAISGDLDAVDEEELEKRRRFIPYGIAA